MRLDLRVNLDDDVREYSFSRRRISVGHGPFNDIVVDRESLGLVFGAFETSEDGEVDAPRFVRGSGGPRTRLLRDDACVEQAEGESHIDWHVQVGDRVVVGGDEPVEISVLAIDRDEHAPWFSVPLPDATLDGLEPDTVRFVAEASRRIAATGGLEPVLESIALLVALRTDELAHHLEFSVPVELDPWRSNQFGLRKLRLIDDDGDQTVRGQFFEDRRALPPLADHASESLDALRELDVAVYDRPTESTTNIYVPVEASGRLGAVLDMSFDAALAEDEVADIVASCSLLTSQASQAVREVRLVRQRVDLTEENRYFRERQRRHYLFKDLIAESDAMRDVYDEVHSLVEQAGPVLILGEAGTGKSLIARALHHLSDRRDGMLTSLNCGEVDGELLDVELFGCVASDLAGDVAARKGIFELASNGTVFLEEIEQLSLLLQGKVLRMLREHEVRRIGDAVARRVETRLIASSHRDLCKLVEAGKFRRDLWMALKGQSLRVPALRERTRDILPLARTFLKQFARRYGRGCNTLGDEVEQMLLDHPWHGNIRELQTVVEAATLNCGAATKLAPDHFML
ncbi:MAG: sigma 54-interacting transcriptional regulator [Myxococcota bacterium]